MKVTYSLVSLGFKKRLKFLIWCKTYKETKLKIKKTKLDKIV